MKNLFAALALISLLSACGAVSGTGVRPTPTPSATPSTSATTSPTASPTPAVSPTPVVSPTPPAGFGLASVTGGSVSAADVTAVRIGNHDGYDRFVIEFSAGVPNYSVTPQTSATFTRSPKGDQVTLQGTSGVLIIVHSVTNWTSYSGPTVFQPGYPYLRQALQVENFEGYQQWALGVQGTAYVRVAVMGSPDRLIVDVTGI
ncbi:MAG TPA: hypothetical protein VF956_10975 [Candidatus Dormibacteraeota bacterium]